MKRFFLLAPIALAACATAPPPVSAGPTVGLGQVASVGRLRVRPVSLLEDSRCPATVQCVWAGQVRVMVEIMLPAAHQIRPMTLGQPIAVRGGRLALVAVDPPKREPGPTDRAQYRFTFRFDGALRQSLTVDAR